MTKSKREGQGAAVPCAPFFAACSIVAVIGCQATRSLQPQFAAERRSSTSHRGATMTNPSTSAALERAERLAEDGRTWAAKRETAALLRRSPSGDAFYLRGRLLMQEGRTAEALAAWEDGWKSQPPSVEAGVALSRWDVRQQNWAAAVERLRLCAAVRPDDAEIQHRLAQAYAGSGDLGGAADSLERAVALGDDGPERYLQLAALQQQLGDRDAARRNHRKGLRLDPEHPLLDRVEELLRAPPAVPAARSPYRPLDGS